MPTKKKPKKNEYFEALGRRKNAIARVRLFDSPEKGQKGTLEVNEKEFVVYFPLKEIQELIKAPLKTIGVEKDFFITARIKGGGITGQAGAMRLGISRALLKVNPSFRTVLKEKKFLTRDSRAKERRKFGLKKARKAPQWSKR